ncbi:MAG: haloalkane dehalogenase [Cyclobacteriaceae bacterium]|jgi:pimeloyl-ACP methyl ester carboxylesterase
MRNQNSILLSVMFLLIIHFAGCNDDDNLSPEDPKNEMGIDTLYTADSIAFLRTPEEQFDNLVDWPYDYRYVEINGLRQAYAEAGPSDGEVVLLLHGQPSWSYLYRKMIPILADNGFRVIAMDHLGFGRSDKPVDITSYSYLGHYDRITRFIEGLGLSDIHLFGQDWGAVLGLRVVGMNPNWFQSVTIGNGFLPNVPAGEEIYPEVENPNQIEDIPSFFDRYTPQQEPYYDNCVRLIEDFDFYEWMVYTMKSSSFHASEVVEGWTWIDLPEEVEAAYDAPFPSREYMAGARVFPSLLNETPGVTQQAWFGLSQFEKPFLTIWGANDPLDLGGCELQKALIDNIPGASGQPHVRFPDASHFLQNDKAEQIARHLIDFYAQQEVRTAQAGFEIRNENAEGELIIWIAVDMTIEEFSGLELPADWAKNQPREVTFSEGMFNRSPGAEENGPLIQKTLAGYEWLYNAKVIERGIPMDNQGLLTGNYIDKYHSVTFDAGSIVRYLISPEGDRYILISRLVDRTTDFFPTPDGWTLKDELIEEEWVLELPNPTLNIRTQNQDSYQGPIEF